MIVILAITKVLLSSRWWLPPSGGYDNIDARKLKSVFVKVVVTPVEEVEQPMLWRLLCSFLQVSQDV